MFLLMKGFSVLQVAKPSFEKPSQESKALAGLS